MQKMRDILVKDLHVAMSRVLTNIEGDQGVKIIADAFSSYQHNYKLVEKDNIPEAEMKKSNQEKGKQLNDEIDRIFGKDSERFVLIGSNGYAYSSMHGMGEEIAKLINGLCQNDDTVRGLLLHAAGGCGCE